MLTLSPISDRLPTISASQALESLKVQRPQAVSTGLSQLDELLQGRDVDHKSEHGTTGGLARGKVTEIYGPPGVGKTTVAIQASAAALRTGDQVVWVDASYDLARPRFYSILDHAISHGQPSFTPASPSNPTSSATAIAKLHNFTTPTLAHLLALIVHATPTFPPHSTSLLVIDSLSTLFDTAYAGQTSKSDLSNVDQRAKDTRRWAANRRFAVLGSLISALNKLAAVNNIAVLVTSQMMTRVGPSGAGTKAILVPALSGKEWDLGVANRVVLFRDWAPEEWRQDSQGKEADGKARVRLEQMRFAGVVKANGVVPGEQTKQGTTLGNVVPFTIDETGIVPYTSDEKPLRPLSSPIKLSSPTSRKRHFEEVADSEAESDDEYGWVEEDEVGAEGLIDEAALTTVTTRDVEEG
ncbi:P-loop containing nucleoside triphosphate hydrolase protein [Viridothelium virens]|uniref:DNA repair protein RAD51 homolog 3 n=1 Tax=Viridothelium virens TaxID=1048519 RepID=A0A6A6HC02_VIRVR|nr:P-loop containing nucleoside triphosphate hydrolase protein [Viridothelium virens]